MATKIFLILTFETIFIFFWGFIDFVIITPLLPLPDDICFYHTNTPPIWVKLFYLDVMEHTEPPFSPLHILLLLLLSLISGFYVGIKVDKWLLKMGMK